MEKHDSDRYMGFARFFAHAQEGRSDWPQWRGLNRDGIVSHSGITHFADDYGLQIVWEKPLGSGYSGISVADGRAITMFSDDIFDYVIALDADNGNELWRFRIDSWA